MKFSLVNGQRQEAQPNLSGKCPACDQAMIAKCGDVKLWHWAHKGRRTCDPWWENETEWHRAWKGQFPVSWQEVVHRAANGEKHIADVKTDQGWVIEFQHSHIDPEERRSRDAFYKKLVWVVDGSTRKRDAAQFQKAWQDGRQVDPNSRIVRDLWNEYALLRDWSESRAPVFFDFGKEEELWWFLGKCPQGLLVGWILRAHFMEFHVGGTTRTTHGLEKFIMERAANFLSDVRAQALRSITMQVRQAPQRYFVPRNKLRGRL